MPNNEYNDFIKSNHLINKFNPIHKELNIDKEYFDDLSEKIESLNISFNNLLNKIDFIFGNNILLNGNFIDISKLKEELTND